MTIKLKNVVWKDMGFNHFVAKTPLGNLSVSWENGGYVVRAYGSKLKSNSVKSLKEAQKKAVNLAEHLITKTIEVGE